MGRKKEDAFKKLSSLTKNKKEDSFSKLKSLSSKQKAKPQPKNQVNRKKPNARAPITRLKQRLPPKQYPAQRYIRPQKPVVKTRYSPSTQKNKQTSNLSILKIILAALGAILITILIIALYAMKSPPKISFYEGDILVTDGTVFMDTEMIGRLSSDGFVKPPGSICKGEHTIKLKISGKSPVEFAFYPFDCRHKEIKYSFTEESITDITPPDKIKFKFIVSETQIKIGGRLFFDGVFYKDTQGSEEISRERCTSIQEIILSIDDNTNITWQNSPEGCEGSDIIKFPISDLELN